MEHHPPVFPEGPHRAPSTAKSGLSTQPGIGMALDESRIEVMEDTQFLSQ